MSNALNFALGIDFGTASVRALIVDTTDGREMATASSSYPTGDRGVVVDSRNPDLARQNPSDYTNCLKDAVVGAIDRARCDSAFAPERIVGVGLDATASTPMPVDVGNRPLAQDSRFCDDPAALAWIWKDHTAHAEARVITDLARAIRPHYLDRCGGVYSPEWYWSKVLHCLRTSPEVFEAATTWVEISDWIPSVLAGINEPASIRRNVCAAGHKAMYYSSWGGFPDEQFLARLDPRLVRLRRSLPDRCHSIAERAGSLSAEWAEKLGLPAGIPIAMGTIDAHQGALGCGVKPGTLVKIIGTSACDIAVAPLSQDIGVIPGLCGIVPESVLPGHHGLEAGQAAVGDIFNWFVQTVRPGGASHEELTAEASNLPPGASGLLGLDWHNGNRTVLGDQRLTGLMLGMTLQTTPAEIYRALIESTAFGARAIVERLRDSAVPVQEIVACGGIALRNPMLMQIYADVLAMPISMAATGEACALGSAMAGAITGGVHADFAAAIAAMVRPPRVCHRPNHSSAEVYRRLYALYRELHDSFGVAGAGGGHYPVMKELLALRDKSRRL